MKKIVLALVMTSMLSACAPHPTQNQYFSGEAGQSTEIEFAKVVKVKEIKIQDRNTGTGAAAGATAGGVAGYQIGNGNGQAGAAIAGVVIGAIIGHVVEQEMQNQKGYEYIVVTEKKKTKSIVQYQAEGDVVFKKGDRVMVQTSGTFQRVMPTDDLPDTVKKPKGIKVVD